MSVNLFNKGTIDREIKESIRKLVRAEIYHTMRSGYVDGLVTVGAVATAGQKVLQQGVFGGNI